MAERILAPQIVIILISVKKEIKDAAMLGMQRKVDTQFPFRNEFYHIDIFICKQEVTQYGKTNAGRISSWIGCLILNTFHLSVSYISETCKC